MNSEMPVVFENKHGLKLFGILHGPVADAQRQKAAIILLSPGVKMRVAPHRMYNKMAAHYASMGFYVLRFDFHGLGDSEGEMQEEYLADLYGNVQVGCYIDDTVASMDWLQATYGVSEFILGGLCGGAITGLLTARNDGRAIGLLGIGIPVILDSKNIDSGKFISQGQSEKLRKGYLRKLLSPKAWLRLLSFRSDYRVIFKIFAKAFSSKPKIQSPENNKEVHSEADNFNYHFPPAFFSMLETSRNIILIFSGADRLRWEYEEKFVQRNKDKMPVSNPCYSMHVIENANHILSSDGSMSKMLEITTAWLNEHYAAQHG